MPAITTEELISNVCSLCNIRRKTPELNQRVLTKDELMMVQSVLLRQQNELKTLKETKNDIKAIVATVLSSIRKENEEA